MNNNVSNLKQIKKTPETNIEKALKIVSIYSSYDQFIRSNYTDILNWYGAACQFIFINVSFYTKWYGHAYICHAFSNISFDKLHPPIRLRGYKCTFEFTKIITDCY